jgi:hypothetical protein
VVVAVESDLIAAIQTCIYPAAELRVIANSRAMMVIGNDEEGESGAG